MLIESLCLNVDNSYLSYKSCGNMDKALVKVKLVPEPKKLHIETPLEELVEAENKAISELRVQRREMAERVKRFTGSPASPAPYMFRVLPTLRHSVDAVRADTTDTLFNHKNASLKRISSDPIESELQLTGPLKAASRARFSVAPAASLAACFGST